MVCHLGDVKNCKGSETLPYYQINELAHHIFMDADRRLVTSGLETKKRNCLLLGVIAVARVSICTSPKIPISHRQQKKGLVTPVQALNYVGREEAQAWRTEIFYNGH